MNSLFTPYPKPRLLFMDAEPCDFPAIVITAYQVVDGAGNWVTGCNSKAEAKLVCERYQAKYPDRKFYAK